MFGEEVNFSFTNVNPHPPRESLSVDLPPRESLSVDLPPGESLSVDLPRVLFYVLKLGHLHHMLHSLAVVFLENTLKAETE